MWGCRRPLHVRDTFGETASARQPPHPLEHLLVARVRINCGRQRADVPRESLREEQFSVRGGWLRSGAGEPSSDKGAVMEWEVKAALQTVARRLLHGDMQPLRIFHLRGRVLS